MALAAATYAVESQDVNLFHTARGKECNGYVSKRGMTIALWPWDKKWWKPTDKKRNLVKAMALLLAELERLDREEE